jgi:hypothetical protein
MLLLLLLLLHSSTSTPSSSFLDQSGLYSAWADDTHLQSEGLHN